MDVGNATEGAGESAGAAGNNDSSQSLSQPADIPAGKLKPNLMLRLKSHNGATKTMNAVSTHPLFQFRFLGIGFGDGKFVLG